MINAGKPEFQIKKATGKRAIAPAYSRHKEESLQGVGLVVVSPKSGRGDQGSFNAQTLSRYNGRKRQFHDFNYVRDQASLKEDKDRVY